MSEREDMPDRDVEKGDPSHGDHEGAPNYDILESDAPLRNPSVRAYRVDEDAVLHDLEQEQVFAVTALARKMWEHCDGNTPLSEIGRTISEAADAPLPDAPLPEVVGALRQVASHLRDQGLLSVPDGDRGDSAEPGNAETLRIVFGAHQVSVRTDVPEFARAVRRVFRGMIGGAPSRTLTPETIDVVTVRSSQDRYHVRGAGGSHAEAGALEGAVRDVKHAVLRRFMEARPDLIWLHAGAATRDGTSVLVAGPWGSGKSTVIAGLCRSGWRYLSDDMAPYAPSSGKILPFPTTIAYREPGDRALSREDLAGLPKKHVGLEPERIQEAPVRPAAIFFPTYDPDRSAKTTPRAAAEAAVSLVESCQNAGRYHGDAIGHLCQLAGRVPAFRLRYNDRSNTSGLLTSVTE